ncbi:MAG: DUF2235 domain-containing protein [Pseudomonadota bacterium]
MAQQAHYDAVGQPTAIGQRSYVWNVMGKLLQVREANSVVASYRYNHRGERISKTAGQVRSYFLYDGGKVQAELDEQGRVARQYIYLAGQPVAIVDVHKALGAGERSALMQAASDIGTAVGAWFTSAEPLSFLHNNHLGAPELATDMAGHTVWQAAYTAFGKLVGNKGAYAHNLRLPGQYEDTETGLYYNHHRYYDPQRGQYLTPDPLGLRAGINTYAYVSGNPLKYVDPDGLILFAFDGTNNSNPPIPQKLISNVVKFYDAYDEILNGKKYYITGINTTNPDMSFKGDLLSGKGFDERLALGFKFLDDFITADTGTDPVQIDVTGFSRGAAEARVWINQLVGKLQDGKYMKGGHARCINLRFEGLWDTVPHLGKFNEDESKYDFSVPTQVKHAVHAIGLNENRGNLANFNLHSITTAPGTASTSSRIEKGFIGAHSDIGGGYKTGDLSDVTLMWMIGQAEGQGIKFNKKTITENGWDIVTNPIIHDPAHNFMDSGNPEASRDVVYGNGRSGDQRTAVFDGKSAADSRAVVNYFRNPFPCTQTEDVGIVDMAKYQVWLTSYGLTMPVGPLVPNRCS